MNDPSKPLVQLDEGLENARASLSSINASVDAAVKYTDEWFAARNKMYSHEWNVIRLHADKLRVHSDAMAKRIGELGGLLVAHMLGATSLTSIGKTPQAKKIIKNPEAYDQARINRLSAGDIRDAIEFNTEFKYTFGFSWIDEEVQEPSATEASISMVWC